MPARLAYFGSGGEGGANGARKTVEGEHRMPMEDRRILVAGAAGAIGGGICAALLDSGARIHALDRDREGLEGVKAECDPQDRMQLHRVDLTEPQVLEPLLEELFSADPRPCAVVACLGRWWDKGALCEQSYPQELHGVMQSSLVPHLVLARHAIPRLRTVQGARYLMINGGTADLPEAGRGLLNLSAAAQRMLALVLAAEEDELEIGTLQLCGPVRPWKRKDGPEDWMDAHGVGAACRRLLEGETSIDGRIFRGRDAASLASAGI